MKSNPTFRQQSNVILAAFLIAAFIIGIAGALQAPTLSRFLTDEVNVPPFLVGLFYSVNAIAGIIISFMLAQYSDRQGNRRHLILFCCLMGIGNSITFAFTRHYVVLITLGISFSAIASATMPQVFALAREYAVNIGRNIVTFNAILRAQISLAWVIGPPLSFALAIHFGFTVMYLSAVGLFLIAVIIVLIFFPSISRQALPEIKPVITEHSVTANHSVTLLFIATVFMWTANMMYLIDMPLYVDKVLHLSSSLPGQLMGIAAGIEIPVMLIAGLVVGRVGKKQLFCFAVMCGILFYIGVILFTDTLILMLLQLLNALFIGVVASIGIIYFQDLMPNRPGLASTLFSNGVATSVILAGLIQGSVAGSLGHHVIYWIALAMISISLLFCLLVRSV
ncbi:sugar efflux transporter [Utexia brackfieldae]|uniref:sugar efflux transporter n=1 Tax=Utexia brackfieldae TaxID=3074108 RepID=UPI00370DA0BB